MPTDRSMTAERSGVIPHWLDPDRDPIEVVAGEDATVTDADGRRYLDFTSQLYCCNLGHSNEAVASAMAEQLGRIPYVSPSKANDTRRRLGAELRSIAPGPLEEVFFCISGSEANEAAAQIAREATGAQTVLTRWRSYHGASYGAAGLTGDPTTRSRVGRYAAVTGTGKFLPPLDYRSPFAADSPGELAERAAEHLEFVIRNEGPESVAAVMTEVVGGTSGAYPPPPGYFGRVRELCDTYDVLLIVDEVITGFGRCGDWFAAETEAVEPDLLTFAKGVTGAYAPLAGVLLRAEVASVLRERGLGVGQTFAGHPVACAAGLAAIDEYRDGHLEAVDRLAPRLEEGLRGLEARHDAVGDVRGRGLLWAVEFTDPTTGEPFVHPWTDDADNPVDAVLDRAREAGLLLGAGRPPVQVLLAPPFCTTEDEVDGAVEVLDSAVADVFG